MSINNVTDRNSLDPKYGSWKFVEEITLQDLIVYPVWVWCLEVDKNGGPEVGSEATMRPLLNTLEVPLDHISPPLILLKIKGTDFYASGIYDYEKKKLESIGIFEGNDIVDPSKVSSLADPVIYISIPAIDGHENIEFEGSKTASDEAFQRP
jgi:hypothetical protein